MLTEKQQAVLDFIRTSQQIHDIPPTSREIQRHFAFKSQNAAICHLRALASKGMIEQIGGDGRSWGLRAAEVQGHLFELPVYGTIPAGVPTMQEQQTADSISVDPALFGARDPRRLWALRVSGDSMIDAHILDGDIAVLERREPRSGEIIAALVDETNATLKRLVYIRGRPILRAENRRYRDIIPERGLQAQGVLIGLIRKGPGA